MQTESIPTAYNLNNTVVPCVTLQDACVWVEGLQLPDLHSFPGEPPPTLILTSAKPNLAKNHGHMLKCNALLYLMGSWIMSPQHECHTHTFFSHTTSLVFPGSAWEPNYSQEK